MRRVAYGVLLLALSGCATVSMVPDQALIERPATEEQTALRAASDAYCADLADRGWVSGDNGLAGLASIVLNGVDEERAASESYADRIGAASADPATVIQRIAEDAATARTGLAQVISEAEGVLDAEASATGRADVTSFERALVRALKANRSFSGALDTVSQRTDQTATAELAIDALSRQIDEARRVADGLAARYAGADRAAS